MNINNGAFFTIGFVFAILGLAQGNLAFGVIGFTFLILSFGSEEDSDDEE